MNTDFTYCIPASSRACPQRKLCKRAAVPAEARRLWYQNYKPGMNCEFFILIKDKADALD